MAKYSFYFEWGKKKFHPVSEWIKIETIFIENMIIEEDGRW